MQILTQSVVKSLLFSVSSHLPPPLQSVDCRAIAHHVTVSKMTFYRDHLQLQVWVSADGARVNCPNCPQLPQGVCRVIQIAYCLYFMTSCILLLVFIQAQENKHTICKIQSNKTG
ncbi:hypothetical protein AMECASPLE_022246 [Ameca splendens]|uniref:Uncharacterized protein n=1 Tax=Ameca splendens TaxID=208324 RepID=A0ABV1AAZ3_9TELE